MGNLTAKRDYLVSLQSHGSTKRDHLVSFFDRSQML